MGFLLDLFRDVLTRRLKCINAIPSITRTPNTSNQDLPQQAPNGFNNEGAIARSECNSREEKKRHEAETKQAAGKEKLARDAKEQTAGKGKLVREAMEQAAEKENANANRMRSIGKEN